MGGRRPDPHHRRRGALRAAQGRLDDALEDLTTAGRWLTALGCVNPAYSRWRSEAALVLFRLHRREEALTLAHEEVDLARVWGAPRPLGNALRSAGLITGGDAGVRLLHEASAVLENSPAMLARARAATALGAALRRANRRAEAREPLMLDLDSLTATELRVARMAAEGLTNREVAQAMLEGFRERVQLDEAA